MHTWGLSPDMNVPSEFRIAGLWPWVVMGIAAISTIPRQEVRAASILKAVGVSLLWFGLFCLTGDRRLFFPYTMQLAIQASCLLEGRVRLPGLVGATAALALFTGIRIEQRANLSVLSVEWAVAIAVLALAATVWRHSPRNWQVRLLLAAAGSLAAFAGLSL